MKNEFLDSAKKQFEYYKMLAEKTFLQLTDEQLFILLNEESNSIATIVKHLSGNMLSRWTDFLTTDGEKEWRQRDSEFDNDIADKAELLENWTSLSIPKGNSKEYNTDKFAKPKHKQHFTDEYLPPIK